MLLELHIKNVALIEEANIEFGKGLNILSGETGAGKSMIIDSINFVLGERTSKDFVRSGTNKAEVEAFFYVDNKAVANIIEQAGIDADEDGTLIIKRTMSFDGKSTARINGTAVTASILKQISENLIDIHGQHEHQSLLKQPKHMDILDKFCGTPLDDLKQALSGYIKSYKQVLKNLEELSGDDTQREKRIELLKYKIEEIYEADLKLGEEEKLNERKTYLINAEKIIHISSRCTELLYSGTEENFSVSDNLSEAEGLLLQLATLDDSVEEMYEQTISLNEEIKELAKNMRKYNENLEIDPDEINTIEERLEFIYRLKRKYGNTIEEILVTLEKAEKELVFIENSEEERKKLFAEKKKLYEKIKSLCEDMTTIRESKAKTISEEITSQLRELEMKNAYFEVQVRQKETFNAKGCDVVEFLISPNLGEELKPLSKIASGGEMSRVMLALKTVVADADVIETFIFDEIDNGISGNTASRVGEKMSTIGKKRQILCITHLPQIASMADVHFLIKKDELNNKTITIINKLEEEGKVLEVARLMGGESGGSVVVEAAREMKKNALYFKNN